MKTKLIVVLSLARSGSSNLIKLFNNFKNIDVNGEIFNKDHPYMFNKNKNRNLFKKEYGDNYQKYILDYNLYIESLKFIIENTEEDFIVIKIFMNQIPFIELKKIIKIADKIIYLERKNILDRYISCIKAVQLNIWENIDTTNHSIIFGIKDYINFKKHHIYTNNNYKRLLNNNKTMYIEYNETKNLDKILKKINLFIPKLKIISNSNISLKIQDKSTEYKDKIKNYEEVEKFVSKELKQFNISN